MSSGRVCAGKSRARGGRLHRSRSSSRAAAGTESFQLASLKSLLLPLLALFLLSSLRLARCSDPGQGTCNNAAQYTEKVASEGWLLGDIQASGVVEFRHAWNCRTINPNAYTYLSANGYRITLKSDITLERVGVGICSLDSDATSALCLDAQQKMTLRSDPGQSAKFKIARE